MLTKRRAAFAARWLSAGVAVAAGSYAAYAAMTWYRYGRVTNAAIDELDPLLDQFMPTCDIAERHHVRVAAPAEITLQAATEMDFQQSAVVRGIFKAREWIMRSHPVPVRDAGAFLNQMRAIGWGVLAETPGHEIVMGAVTQPWMADVVFRPLPPEEFAAFHEPGHVKIVWTLRADPVSVAESIFRTETRALATDPKARAKFRRYWSLASPGIIAIRWMLLGPLKAEAERRAFSQPRLMASGGE